MEVLLRAGADPNRPTTDRYRVTPLVRAASTGFAASIPPLLAGGASVEGESGFAAIRAASRFATEGHLEAIRLLAKAGAPMHAERAHDDPLMRAISDKQYEALKVLLDSGADVNRAFENDITPVIHACWFSNDPTALATLLKHKPNLDHFARFPQVRKGFLGVDQPGPGFVTMTALMLASAGGKEKMVDLLLAAGADPYLANNLGQTAKELARRGGHKKVIELLERADH